MKPWEIVSGQLSDMNKNIIDLTGEVGGLKAASESQGREIRDLKTKSENLGSEISTLTGRLSSNDDNTGMVRGDVIAAQERITAMEKNCALQHKKKSSDSIPAPPMESAMMYAKRFGMPSLVFFLLALVVYLLTKGQVNLFVP